MLALATLFLPAWLYVRHGRATTAVAAEDAGEVVLFHVADQPLRYRIVEGDVALRVATRLLLPPALVERARTPYPYVVTARYFDANGGLVHESEHVLQTRVSRIMGDDGVVRLRSRLRGDEVATDVRVVLLPSQDILPEGGEIEVAVVDHPGRAAVRTNRMVSRNELEISTRLSALRDDDADSAALRRATFVSSIWQLPPRGLRALFASTSTKLDSSDAVASSNIRIRRLPIPFYEGSLDETGITWLPQQRLVFNFEEEYATVAQAVVAQPFPDFIDVHYVVAGKSERVKVIAGRADVTIPAGIESVVLSLPAGAQPTTMFLRGQPCEEGARCTKRLTRDLRRSRSLLLDGVHDLEIAGTADLLMIVRGIVGGAAELQVTFVGEAGALASQVVPVQGATDDFIILPALGHRDTRIEERSKYWLQAPEGAKSLRLQSDGAVLVDVRRSALMPPVTDAKVAPPGFHWSDARTLPRTTATLLSDGVGLLLVDQQRLVPDQVPAKSAALSLARTVVPGSEMFYFRRRQIEPNALSWCALGQTPRRYRLPTDRRGRSRIEVDATLGERHVGELVSLRADDLVVHSWRADMTGLHARLLWTMTDERLAIVGGDAQAFIRAFASDTPCYYRGKALPVVGSRIFRVPAPPVGERRVISVERIGTGEVRCTLDDGRPRRRPAAGAMRTRRQGCAPSSLPLRQVIRLRPLQKMKSEVFTFTLYDDLSEGDHLLRVSAPAGAWLRISWASARSNAAAVSASRVFHEVESE